MVVVGAGLPLGQLLTKAINKDLAGLEWAVGIPGTVGGGVVSNCGAYGHSISESVIAVWVLTEGGEIKKYFNEQQELPALLAQG